jgi:polyhydroxyalkanoate synthesis regulator phasin
MPRRGGAASPVAAARDKLVRGVLSPFNAVVITRRNLEEVLDDAVRRGRMTRTDAQDMIQTLVTRGARVTDDILAEIQRMLGNTAALDVDSPAGASGSAPRLPISDYDELSAAQVQERLAGLSHVQLRHLRDYEQRNANRKTVLERIDRKLR